MFETKDIILVSASLNMYMILDLEKVNRRYFVCFSRTDREGLGWRANCRAHLRPYVCQMPDIEPVCLMFELCLWERK